MNTSPDAVHAGLAEWDKTKRLAAEAIERCRQAEENSSFARGQLEAVKTENAKLASRNAALTEENAEIKMLLSDLGRRFLEVLENSKLAPFRPPGRGVTATPPNPPRNGTDGGGGTDYRPIPIPPLRPGQFSALLDELSKQIGEEVKSIKPPIQPTPIPHKE